MSKKRTRRKQETRPAQRWHARSKVLIAIVLLLGLVGLSLAHWRIARNPVTRSSLLQQGSPTPKLSKEYIYAGGKLLAIEEAGSGGTSLLSAPSSLIATGTAAPHVNLNWTASTGGTVDHYQVERCQNFAPNCYTVVADNVPPNSPTINYTDTTVSAGSAYLYRVRAVDSSGNSSNYSGIDLATAVTFANDPLISSAVDPINATPIRAAHFNEMRDAVNAVRRLVDAQAAPFNWSDSSHPPQVGGSIYVTHLNDLRTNLSNALFALGFPRPSYESPDPMVSQQPIRAIHVQQLRDLVK
jgi:hypothetical protein